MSAPKPPRLGVNVDHVATVRNARGGTHPDPVKAAREAIAAGADGITAHLREDRRHIRDDDIIRLRAEIDKPLNFEMAATPEMTAIALRVLPHACCIVPERREEVTTEGGLDVVGNRDRVQRCVDRLHEAEIEVSLFIDPDERQIDASKDLGVSAVELHTGRYADAGSEAAQLKELFALTSAGAHARKLDLLLHMGHGLTYRNVVPVARVPEVGELNIGHSIVARAVMVGFERAVREMKALIG